MSYLFYVSSDDLVTDLYQISCMEAAAFLNFQESGVENPEVVWNQLSEGQKTAWIPDESEADAWTYISNMPDWRDNFLWTGWPVMCQMEYKLFANLETNPFM